MLCIPKPHCRIALAIQMEIVKAEAGAFLVVDFGRSVEKLEVTLCLRLRLQL